MTVTKVTIVPPANSYAGWQGRIYLSNGKTVRVMDKVLVEPHDIGGAFQWDYSPFEAAAACKRATIAKARHLGWGS